MLALPIRWLKSIRRHFVLEHPRPWEKRSVLLHIEPLEDRFMPSVALAALRRPGGLGSAAEQQLTSWFEPTLGGLRSASPGDTLTLSAQGAFTYVQQGTFQLTVNAAGLYGSSNFSISAQAAVNFTYQAHGSWNGNSLSFQAAQLSFESDIYVHAYSHFGPSAPSEPTEFFDVQFSGQSR